MNGVHLSVDSRKPVSIPCVIEHLLQQIVFSCQRLENFPKVQRAQIKGAGPSGLLLAQTQGVNHALQMRKLRRVEMRDRPFYLCQSAHVFKMLLFLGGGKYSFGKRWQTYTPWSEKAALYFC